MSCFLPLRLSIIPFCFSSFNNSPVFMEHPTFYTYIIIRINTYGQCIWSNFCGSVVRACPINPKSPASTQVVLSLFNQVTATNTSILMIITEDQQPTVDTMHVGKDTGLHSSIDIQYVNVKIAKRMALPQRTYFRTWLVFNN